MISRSTRLAASGSSPLIAEESERLGRIVNEILLANQLDSGQVIRLGPFDRSNWSNRLSRPRGRTLAGDLDRTGCSSPCLSLRLTATRFGKSS
jgi:hypothetical protein